MQNGKTSSAHRTSQSKPLLDSPGKEFRVVVVGGGPAGLFTAWNLKRKAGSACKITILEATERLGGKICTRNFPAAGIYEAGVAEIYVYSGLGPDPLRDLIEKDLGLQIKQIQGGSCCLDGKLIHTVDDLGQHFGERTKAEAKAFRAKCAELLSPQAFYKSAPTSDNQHAWARMSGEELLATEIKDDQARRYIRAMAHSDVAAGPHLTSGLTFLKNVLMDVDGYMDIVSVVGGNEQIVERLFEQLDAEVRLHHPVRSIEPLEDGTYRVEAVSDGTAETFIADFVAVALPLSALSLIQWRSESLQLGVGRHVAHFDHPAHYVRATLLFERPFWREHLSGAWWMVDAFDGCAVYDEAARHPMGHYGALGFLIAGNAALWMANLTDEQVERLCLDALPPELAYGRKLIVDRRIHRWMASVSAQPGGFPARQLGQNHRPDPASPGLFLVGDYIFDATLNGAFDSSDATSDMMLAEMLLRRRAEQARAAAARSIRPKRRRDAIRAAVRVLPERDRFLERGFLKDMLKICWDIDSAKILVAGPALGVGLSSLRYEGDLTDLPFPGGRFDLVVETGLCYLPRHQLKTAARELRRVARHGVVLGSVTCDLAIDLLERYDLLAGVETLASRWDWSEQLAAGQFQPALLDPTRLGQAWDRALAEGAGPGGWYDEPESLLYSFYTCSPATAPKAASDGADRDKQVPIHALSRAHAAADMVCRPSTLRGS